PEPLLHPLQPLARDAILAARAMKKLLEGRDLVLDHPPLEWGRHGDELEGRVGDDDGVPAGGGRACQEAGALVLRKVGLVGDQDAGGRIELQEFAAGLGVIRNPR
ncbi:MAG: hypothetical protein JO270_17680, partial [Acidobacteriaceae bacterium]|nr:hypothetical protein [Acidobacteriaceae bacterium]